MAVLSGIRDLSRLVRRGVIARGMLAAVLAAMAVCARVAAQDQPTDYQVKAAFLEKFGKFVEWPDNVFATSTSPVVIGIFIDDPFGSALKSLAGADTINGRPIEIRDIKNLSELKDCHVVFIPASAKASEPDALAAVAGQPVLTVGETDEFYNDGGMIQFIIQNKQVHFRIRNEAARAAGLKISSKLLILARRA
jgi:YfiR/HmsC-like